MSGKLLQKQNVFLISASFWYQMDKSFDKNTASEIDL